MLKTYLRRCSLVMLMCAGSFVPAQAQTLELHLQQGRISLRAQNVPLRDILAEWARQGGVTIVNGERTMGVPMTLQLSDVREDTALAVVLREVSGYIVVARNGGNGSSALERVVILPTSTPPRPGPSVAAAVDRRRAPKIDFEAVESEPVEPESAPRGVSSPPPVRERAARREGPVPSSGMPSGMPSGTPLPTSRPAGDGAAVAAATGPADVEPLPVAPPARTVPQNPFGVSTGSATPGVVSPSAPPPPPPKPAAPPAQTQRRSSTVQTQ